MVCSLWFQWHYGEAVQGVAFGEARGGGLHLARPIALFWCSLQVLPLHFVPVGAKFFVGEACAGDPRSRLRKNPTPERWVVGDGKREATKDGR